MSVRIIYPRRFSRAASWKHRARRAWDAYQRALPAFQIICILIMVCFVIVQAYVCGMTEGVLERLGQ